MPLAGRPQRCFSSSTAPACHPVLAPWGIRQFPLEGSAAAALTEPTVELPLASSSTSSSATASLAIVPLSPSSSEAVASSASAAPASEEASCGGGDLVNGKLCTTSTIPSLTFPALAPALPPPPLGCDASTSSSEVGATTAFRSGFCFPSWSSVYGIEEHQGARADGFRLLPSVGSWLFSRCGPISTLGWAEAQFTPAISVPSPGLLPLGQHVETGSGAAVAMPTPPAETG